MTTKSFIKTIGGKGLLSDYNSEGKKLQTELTFDTTPTADSTNPVTSGGIKTAINSAAGSATAKKFTGYNTSNIVPGRWYIIALKNGGASEWERLYEFLISSNDNSAEQMRVLFSPRIISGGGFADSKVFISGHIIKNTSLLANWKFATLKNTAGTTYTALCVKGTYSSSSRSVYWNVRSVRGYNDWNPVSINLDTTNEYTIVSELPFNGANSLPNCITTDSVTLNKPGNEFNASLPITSGGVKTAIDNVQKNIDTLETNLNSHTNNNIVHITNVEHNLLNTILTPPASGNAILKSVNGVIQWVSE